MFLFTTTDRPDNVQSALRDASHSTGVDFDYLLDTAQRESNLDAGAKARTSSASGLFQFIESTWLAMMKEAGPRHGYGDVANRIERTTKGSYQVADRGTRDEILALRHDPKAAALMAGEFTRQNAEALQTGLGRAPDVGELYIAHFLGAQGAVELIRLAETSPNAPAAAHFPAAAKANRPVFMNGDGHARGAAEVYANLTGSHGGASEAPAASEMVFAFAPPRTEVDQVFHGMFADTQPAAGLGPIGRSVSAFWGGMFRMPEVVQSGEPAPAEIAGPARGDEPRPVAVEPAPQPVAATQTAADNRWRDPSLPLPAEVGGNLFRVW